MIKRRQFLATTMGVLAAPAVFRSGYAASPDVKLKLHHFLGPKSPAQVKMLEPWAKRIEKDSNGRIQIEIYPSMTLGGAPPQLFRQAADGVVDIVWTVNGYTPGLFPRSEAFELPTVFVNDIGATNLAMRDLYEDHLKPEYDSVHLLFTHVHAGQALQMADKAVHTVKDTQGTKLRVPGPTGNDVVKALGATPVTMPVPDLPQALSTHTVDGALIPWEIIPALKLQDVTQYQIEGPDKTRFGTTTFQVSMNKAKWQSLPDDLKKVFDRNCGRDWLKEVGQIWREDDDEGIKVATDAGNTYIVLKPDEMETFNAVLRPVVKKWVDDHKGDIEAQAIVDAARAAIEKNAS